MDKELTIGKIKLPSGKYNFVPGLPLAVGGTYNTKALIAVYRSGECHDDVHVFPCKHCGACQCGKAKLSSEAAQ